MNRHLLLLSILIAVSSSLLGTISVVAAEGYYRVAEIDGVWWFINPQGQPFYSLGVSDIGPGAVREKYDSKQPAYAAFRHYDSTKSWADDTTKRLKGWNFNTLGSWAHPSLTHGPMPYAEVLHLGAHVGVPWNDLFSDDFPTQMDKLAKARVPLRSDDRNLLGWYTDNELSWYPDTLFNFHLSQSGSTATRAKLMGILEEHYQRDFASLQRDFEVTGAADFNDLSGIKLKLRPGGKGRVVIQQFAAAAAERYYHVMHDVIRHYDANHLILGDRYPWHCPQAVAKAAGPFVDVISTNFDWPEATDGYLPCGYLRNLHLWSGRPVLVSEYYVAAQENRSGNKNTGEIFLTVDNQKTRAAAAQGRLQCLAEQPYVVGAHWFRFADEPTHGRSDGEDYNFGLVDINNRPYEELVAGITRLNSDIPRLHKASRKSTDPATGPIRIPAVQAEASALHEQLSRTQSLGPIGDSLGVYELAAAWKPDRLYLAAMVCHVSERETYSGEFRDDHTLELTVSSPEMGAPVRIRFGGANGAQSDNDQVKCWISANGLRHTLIVPIPSQVLGKSALRENGQVNLQLSLRDLRDENSAKWQNTCLLVADHGDGRPTEPRQEQTQAKAVSPQPVSTHK